MNAPRKKNAKRQAIEQRNRARRLLVQTLYQWQLSDVTPEDCYQQRMVDDRAGEVDEDYCREGFFYITAHKDELEARFAPFMSRQLARLDAVERAILWLGTYEITQRFDIHKNIAINEAIELAKQFGADDSYKFINATLDKITP